MNNSLGEQGLSAGRVSQTGRRDRQALEDVSHGREGTGHVQEGIVAGLCVFEEFFRVIL